MSIELDNSAAASVATKSRLPSLPPEMWENIFSHRSVSEIMNFVGHNKHALKASGKKEVSVDYTDRVLVLNKILHGVKLALNGHAFSEVQLRNLYEEVFGTKLELKLAKAFVQLVSKYNKSSNFLATFFNDTALLCSSDHMWKTLGIDVTYWLREDQDLFLDFVRSKLVKATAVHDTPELNIPGLAELQASQHSIDSALIKAAAQGSIESAIVQIKNGADVEKQDKYRDTALIHAAHRNNLELVKYLIEKCGADVEKQNEYGETVLMRASRCFHLELVKYLVGCGADVEKQDKHGVTVLMRAAEYKNIKAVKYLIEECGADVEKQNKYGVTVLMHAAEYKNIKAVKYLVGCGANPREAKVALEKAFGQYEFAKLNGRFLDVTSEGIFYEVLGSIVQAEAFAFLGSDSPLAGVYVDASNGLV
jgi:ankyrin repeat protein